jgi:hypothetical protein
LLDVLPHSIRAALLPEEAMAGAAETLDLTNVLALLQRRRSPADAVLDSAPGPRAATLNPPEEVSSVRIGYRTFVE